MAFASVPNMNIDLAKKFLDVIPSEKDFFTISQKELQSITNSRSKVLSMAYRQGKLEEARKEVEFIKRNKITATYFTDPNYPLRLLNTPDAPSIVYSMGNCDLNAKHIISIVGTRHATIYGRNFVNHFVEDVAANLDDAIIVSGLAYGIDIAAHEACLKHNVPTIAVLAHGLNTIYPSQHRQYAADIVHRNGAILTEYTTQASVNKGNFVARNRIVAGLSDCTLVVESAEHGGALITANIAQGYSRDVFAVPGKVNDEFSSGCNKLIRANCAQLATCLDDVIEAMGWTKKQEAQAPRQKSLFPETTKEEDEVIALLKTQEAPMHINTITQSLGKPVYKLLSTLVNLEFKGIVVSCAGSRYTLA